MNPIAEFVKENRKAAGLTQEQFALRSGLGLRLYVNLNKAKRPFVWTKLMWHLQCLTLRPLPERRKINDCIHPESVLI